MTTITSDRRAAIAPSTLHGHQLVGDMAWAAAAAAVGTFALVVTIVSTVIAATPQTGLAGRVMGVAKIGWPLAAVLSGRRPEQQI
jgi:hypothetical protein